MKRMYRLKNKRRFVSFLFLFIMVGLCIGSVVSAAGNIQDETQVVTIRPGDTLWDIAQVYSNHVEIRKYIYEIKKVNQLENSTIYAGQQLVLP